MQELFDVFITDPIVIDQDIYKLWLNGKSVADTISLRWNNDKVNFENIKGSSGLHQKLLKSDTEGQYRMFDMLEPYLCVPEELDAQLLYQVPSAAQGFIIESYFEFDDFVIRHLLGSKLTTKFRKDMDVVAESTEVPLRSCLRQFDNLRRIYSSMEDKNFQGNISHLIRREFRLSEDLAWRYTCILFLLHARFQIQPSIQKTKPLKLAEFECIAAIMMQEWIGTAEYHNESPRFKRRHTSELSPTSVDLEQMKFQSNRTLPIGHSLHEEHLRHIAEYSKQTLKEHMSLDYKTSLSVHDWKSTLMAQQDTIRNNVRGIEIDITMSNHLRDIKTHLFNNRNALEQFKESAMEALCTHSNDKQIEFKLKSRFNGLMHALLDIGTGLSHTKDLKNFFIHLVANVGGLFKDAGLALKDIDLCFRSIASSLGNIPNAWYLNADLKATYETDWKRYLFVCKICIIQMNDYL